MSDHSHSHSDSLDHGHDHDHADHGGLGKYLAVFVALCVLTGASFFTYSDLWPFKETPQVGWAFMMAVSCTKAMLVILFFMHLLWEANWKYVLTVPATFMAIFLVLMLVPDIGMRSHYVSEERLRHMAVPEETHEDGHAAEEGHQHEGDAAAPGEAPH
jgi:cytochrome c oxidase subunit 4